MPRGRKPDHVRCTVADCGRKHYAKGFCSRHYRQKRRLEGPRCSVPGCDRKVYARGRCEGHDKAPTRTIRPVRANTRDRTLAWGRLYLQRSSVPVVAAEARRRQLSPGGLISDVIDQWAKALESGAWPRNSLAPCAFPGCPRPLYVRGLCRTHHAQRERGQELTPILRSGTRRGVRCFRSPTPTGRAVEAAAAHRRVAGHSGRRAGAPGAGGGAALSGCSRCI